MFFALPEDDQLSEYGRPGPAAQHPFSKTSCEWKQNRVNMLLAALDEHTASCDALAAEIGCHEADDLVHELYEPIVDMISRMEAIEPQTIAGCQAKTKCSSVGIGSIRRQTRMTAGSLSRWRLSEAC